MIPFCVNYGSMLRDEASAIPLGEMPKVPARVSDSSSSYDEGLGAADKLRLWVEVGDDLEYVRCDATFSVLSLTPPRFLLHRPLVARKL